MNKWIKFICNKVREKLKCCKWNVNKSVCIHFEIFVKLKCTEYKSKHLSTSIPVLFLFILLYLAFIVQNTQLHLKEVKYQIMT